MWGTSMRAGETKTIESRSYRQSGDGNDGGVLCRFCIQDTPATIQHDTHIREYQSIRYY
jgi:hypothetical protein